MDAEDYQEAREVKARTSQQRFEEMRNAVHAAPEHVAAEKPKCYLCGSTEGLHYNNRNPGFWMCPNHSVRKEIEVKVLEDGTECPF